FGLVDKIGIPAVADVAGKSQGRREVVTQRGDRLPGALFVFDFFFEKIAEQINDGKIGFCVVHGIATQFVVGGGTRIAGDAEALAGPEIMITEAAAYGVAQEGQSGIGSVAVGIADLPGIMLVVGADF